MRLVFELLLASFAVLPFKSEIKLARNVLVELLSDPAILEIREYECYDFEEYFSQVDVTFALLL